MADLKLDDEIAEVTGLGNVATGWATKVQNLLNAALKSNLNPFGTAATKDVAAISGGSSEQGKIPVLDVDGKVPDIFINIPSGEIDTSNIPDRTLPAIKLQRGTLTGPEFADDSLGHRKIVASGVDSNGDPFPGRFVLGYSGGRFSFLKSDGYAIGDLKTLAYQPSPLPNGWLPCDGRSLERTKYSDLFSAISTTYGNVDNDTFNLPDLRGRTIASKGTSESFNSIGKTGGTEMHILTNNEMPSHTHFLIADVNLTTATSATADEVDSSNHIAESWFVDPNNNPTLYYEESSYHLAGGLPNGEPTLGLSSEIGGDAAHTNLQPYIVMYHIIYTGITS